MASMGDATPWLPTRHGVASSERTPTQKRASTAARMRTRKAGTSSSSPPLGTQATAAAAMMPCEWPVAHVKRSSGCSTSPPSSVTTRR